MVTLVIASGGGPLYMKGGGTLKPVSNGHIANAVNFEKNLGNYLSADLAAAPSGGTVVYMNNAGNIGTGTGYIYPVWEIDPQDITDAKGET